MGKDKEPVKQSDTYSVENITFTVPEERDFEILKYHNQINFAEPEALLDTWVTYYIVHGPKLIEPVIEHFKTLSEPDMPADYVEEFIKEFWERVEIELFKMKDKRFKLIKRHDIMSRAFNKELNIRSGLTIDDIDEMSGLEFEYFLCRLFRSEGYNASLTKASNDQGADLILEKLGERTVVQAKRYFNAVSNGAIQEVVAAKAIYRCQYAMVVTSSYFTKSAIMLARSNKVALYDREKLKEKLENYNLKLANSVEEP